MGQSKISQASLSYNQTSTCYGSKVLKAKMKTKQNTKKHTRDKQHHGAGSSRIKVSYVSILKEICFNSIPIGRHDLIYPHCYH